MVWAIGEPVPYTMMALELTIMLTAALGAVALVVAALPRTVRRARANRPGTAQEPDQSRV